MSENFPIFTSERKRATISLKSIVRVRNRDGFSLVEVTIALAIAALAITVLLGLTPSGLDSLRQSGNMAAETSITRQMLSELQSADWGVPGGGAPGWINLGEYNNQKRYFDDQGIELSSGADSFVSYVARYSFPGQSVTLPGGDAGAGGGSPDMILVTVDIAANPNPGYAFENPNQFTSRTWIIARQY